MPNRLSLDRWRVAAAAAPLVLGAVVGWGADFMAQATPLEAGECAQLKTEEADLTKAGVRANLAKGPQWAKANLGAEAMERVQRLISVDEQIAFRCPRPPPPKTDAENAPAAKPKPKVKAAKVEAKSNAAAKDGDGQAPPAAAKATPKPKPKAAPDEDAAPAAKPAPKTTAPKAARAKPDDAYRAPGRAEPDRSQQ